jgi:Uma2 family endonuclease
MSVRDMSLFELEVPPSKPQTEWVRGRAMQKVIPGYDHAVLQRLVLTALGAWADGGGHGRVGAEWGFRVAPPDGIVRPLVPDVAFLSYEALSHDTPREALQRPLTAPTVAIEIVSPEDRRLDLNDKIATYLESGTEAVIVVDLHAETVELHDEELMSVLGPGDELTHPALPGFTLDVGELFARAKA